MQGSDFTIGLARRLRLKVAVAAGLPSKGVLGRPEAEGSSQFKVQPQ